jgi:nucleotide-binding universal stress UspA family protein
MIARSKPMRIEIKRICVPTDFSPQADCSLAYGLNLARQAGAELHLLHVLARREDLARVQEHPDFTSDSLFVTDFLGQLERGGEGGQAEGLWSDINVTRAFRLGKPAEAICEYAGAEGIDLVVIASHGRTGVEHILMGSVAEQVVRKCPCPVLTVRREQHDFLVEDRPAED